MLKVISLRVPVKRGFAAFLRPSFLVGEEQEKIRAARAKFFSTSKRKETSTPCSSFDSKASSSTQMPSEPPKKRFKFPNMSRNKMSTSDSETPLIIAFYDPSTQAEDARGRTLEEILAWNDGKLESCHNYIQMLFPLPEGSPFNWEAPVVDREVFDAFRARSDLRDQLRKSFVRMLEFYGFELATATDEDSTTKSSYEQGPAFEDQNAPTETDVNTNMMESNAAASTEDTTISTISPNTNLSITRSPRWQASFRNWAVRFDHNHLRITRIIRCLRVLGLDAEAYSFFKTLEDVYNDPAININLRSMRYWTHAMGRPLHIAPDGEESEWLREWENEQQAFGEAERAKATGSKGQVGTVQEKADDEE